MSEMRGLQELLENIETVGVTLRSAARGATNAAAQVVKREAVLNARAQGLVDTGALVNNIAVKRERDTPPNITEYHIGVRHGKEAKGAQKVAVRGADGKLRFEYTDNPFYWLFWEFGYVAQPGGRHIAARPFIRPAMLSKEGQLLDVMKDWLAARLDKAVLKATT